MENAARAVTDAAMEMIAGQYPGVLIVCGGGNNGGDGLAVARHLHNRGVSVEIALAADPKTYTGDAAINFEIVRAMGIPSPGLEVGHTPPALGRAELIVDALFGTGLRSPPRTRWQIDLMNERGVPVLAVDVPSGLDCDTGEPLGPACVRATRTVTFVAEKTGFANPAARQYLGEVIVGDIGCPREVIEKVWRGDRPA
jgi:NAD(P)H-hydrate epimerase